MVWLILILIILFGYIGHSIHCICCALDNILKITDILKERIDKLCVIEKNNMELFNDCEKLICLVAKSAGVKIND